MPSIDELDDTMHSLALEGLALFKKIVEGGTDWLIIAHLYKAISQRSTAGSTPEFEPDGTADRTLLASLIGKGGVVPPEFQERLSSGLQALNQGKTEPLLTPVRLKRPRLRKHLAHLRLMAVCQAHFKWGQGLKKELAIAEVAEALATSSANIRKWEQIINSASDIGDINLCKRAKHAGQLAKRFPSDENRSYIQDNVFFPWFGHPQALPMLAENFKQLKRRSA